MTEMMYMITSYFFMSFPEQIIICFQFLQFFFTEFKCNQKNHN